MMLVYMALNSELQAWKRFNETLNNLSSQVLSASPVCSSEDGGFKAQVQAQAPVIEVGALAGTQLAILASAAEKAEARCHILGLPSTI